MNTPTHSAPQPSGSSPTVTIRVVTIKGLLRHRARFALTAIAVVISVAFFASVMLLTSSLRGTAERDIAAANARIETVVQGREYGGEVDGGPGAETPRYELPARTVDQIAAAIPDAAVAGISSAPATFTSSEGDLLDTGGRPTRVETWVDNPALNTHHLIGGSEPAGPTLAVIERRMAEGNGLEVGDSFRITTDLVTVGVTVAGVADFATVDGSPQSALVLISPDSGFVRTDVLDRIAIDHAGGASTTTDVEAVLADDPQAAVTDGPDYIAELQSEVSQQANFISTFLTFFAAIALIAGTTIIYNTFVISVQQRTREVALLRSIGARRGQILRSVLGEAALIGAIASAVGVAVGLLLYRAMVALFETLGLSFLSTSPSYALGSLTIPFLIGVTVTVLSATMPARRAASVPPMAALRDQAIDSSNESRLRRSATFVLVVGAVGTAIASLASGSGLLGLIATGTGLLLLIVGGPLLVTATSASLGWPVARLAGATGRIAQVNLSRNPRRSASTSFSLSLSIALMIMFTAIAASISGGVADDIEAGLTADTILVPITTDGPAGQTLTLPDQTVAAVAATNGVTASATLDLTTGVIDESTEWIGLIDPPAFASLYDPDVSAGSITDLGTAQIAVNESTELRIGDTLTLELADGASTTVTVGAIFGRAIPAPDESPRYILNRTIPAAIDATTVSLFAATDGTPATTQALEDLARNGGAIRSLSRADYVASVASSSDDFRNFVYALLGITLVISLVGIANTSAMSINERIREIGVMRAIGTTPMQVRRIVRLESVLLAVHGCILGIVLGLASAASLIALLGGDEGLTLHVPWGSMAILGVAGVAAGVLASAWPAWRGSRQDILDAIASE